MGVSEFLWRFFHDRGTQYWQMLNQPKSNVQKAAYLTRCLQPPAENGCFVGPSTRTGKNKTTPRGRRQRLTGDVDTDLRVLCQ